MHEPVSWIPALGSWIVTRRDLAVEAMRDADAFTVDDPRFSTGAVIGQSMLSLDGPEHQRHRAAFADHFRPKIVREQFELELTQKAEELVAEHLGAGSIEFRSQLAGPLAVDTITKFLGLANVNTDDVLDWYVHISDAIVGIALGHPVSAAGTRAIDAIHERVQATLDGGESPLLNALASEDYLRPEELPTATAVVMFGAIETSEGMTTNALWHLLNHPDVLGAVRSDRSLLSAVVEESLRLEPAAAVVDRYTTRDVELGDVTIPERDMVTISLLGANRDPDVFPEPDRFDITRTNLNQHVTFLQGPHGCLGLHLARLETLAALAAVLDRLPTTLALDESRTSSPNGLIFRKSANVTATWLD